MKIFIKTFGCQMDACALDDNKSVSMAGIYVIYGLWEGFRIKYKEVIQ